MGWPRAGEGKAVVVGRRMPVRARVRVRKCTVSLVVILVCVCVK